MHVLSCYTIQITISYTHIEIYHLKQAHKTRWHLESRSSTDKPWKKLDKLRKKFGAMEMALVELWQKIMKSPKCPLFLRLKTRHRKSAKNVS